MNLTNLSEKDVQNIDKLMESMKKHGVNRLSVGTISLEIAPQQKMIDLINDAGKITDDLLYHSSQG